ncbi:MAG: flagellar basal body L-ring protein FlgH [Caedimonas sp.]|nr:flagellar basal body L-ring protein FlgH [Caedimonas sp.]
MTESRRLRPNSDFVINGRHEFRVNYDVRELVIEGIVRPEDMTATKEVLLI